MKNILVPVGSSKNVVCHLQYAIDFAKEFGATVYAVQIYNVSTKAGTLMKVDDILERGSKEYLDEVISKVDKKGVSVLSQSFKGDLVDTLEAIYKNLKIDLVLIEPRTNSIKEQVYLGKTSGRMVKQTDLPILIVPEGLKFEKIHTILMATKSAVIKRDHVLLPLIEIKRKFDANLKLLMVKTPFYKKEDFVVKPVLSEIVDKTVKTESPTTFQAVLENYKDLDPNMLCVVRRKRGFFKKLWEKNTILKKDFHSSTMPVLVLSGLK